MSNNFWHYINPSSMQLSIKGIAVFQLQNAGHAQQKLFAKPFRNTMRAVVTFVFSQKNK